ncbi:hypothetical protein FCV25MIE_14471 [Fagus crenata]
MGWDGTRFGEEGGSEAETVGEEELSGAAGKGRTDSFVGTGSIWDMGSMGNMGVVDNTGSMLCVGSLGNTGAVDNVGSAWSTGSVELGQKLRA